jgi:5-methyltetrahydropteroyltriglutamate--homocysteine methyltransferase
MTTGGTTVPDAVPSQERTPARVEHVGSLLRPPPLREELERIYTPGHTALLADERAKDRTRLHELEDEGIAAAVRRQEELGLDVLTDGEFRRIMFTNSFYDAVEGVGPSERPLEFRADDGSVVEFPGPVALTGRLRRIDNPAAREAAHMRSLTGRRFKVTFPAASWFCVQSMVSPARREGIYDSDAELLSEIVGIQHELVEETIAAGAPHIQFDLPAHSFLVDPHFREMLPALGASVERLMAQAVDVETALLSALPGHVTKAVHLCRGNYRSRYMAGGVLEPVAESLFSLPYDRFLVEWEDTEREGDFSALRFVPRGGPVVVMGIMSSKSPRVEDEDELVRRLDEAARYLPIEQLAISPQCGFSSALVTGEEGGTTGNEITEDVQWRKLEVLMRVGERVWGR